MLWFPPELHQQSSSVMLMVRTACAGWANPARLRIAAAMIVSIQFRFLIAFSFAELSAVQRLVR